MRKVVAITGLIILIIAEFPLILGLGALPNRFPGGESRLPFPMILLFVIGITTIIVGVVLSSSKKKGDSFRMGY